MQLSNTSEKNVFSILICEYLPERKKFLITSKAKAYHATRIGIVSQPAEAAGVERTRVKEAAGGPGEVVAGRASCPTFVCG